MRKRWRFVAFAMILSGLLALGIRALADSASMPPSALKEIADEAFMGDAGITGLALPDDVERIGEHAFAQSGLSLEHVQVGEGSYAEQYRKAQGIEFTTEELPVLESDHPYADAIEQSWTWSGEADTLWLEVTFSAKTALAADEHLRFPGYAYRKLWEYGAGGQNAAD